LRKGRKYGGLKLLVRARPVIEAGGTRDDLQQILPPSQHPQARLRSTRSAQAD